MGTTEGIFDNPLHPYTKMLMASIPRLDKKWEGGEVELKVNHSELTGGCVYYGRCPVAFSKCLERPPLLEIEKDHWVACWKEFEKKPKARQDASL
jgi:peptide/nickel transport system ATP-binding protein